MWEINSSDWIIASATLMGPILAVQAQKWLESLRRTRDNRLGVFYTLMATRATRVAPAHVEALNRIDLEFRPDRYWFFQPKRKLEEKSLVEACRQYAQQLDTTFDENAEAQRVAWNTKTHDLFYELLHKMSGVLGFKFEKSDLQKNAYYPKAHGWREDLQAKVLVGAAEFLQGHQSLKMAVTEFPVSDSAAQRQIELSDLMKNVLSEGSVKVNLTSAPKSKSKTSRR